MAEINYVLSTVDLDVFGGPTSLDVSTDFGKTGDRGSKIWVGNGDPALNLTNQDIKIDDFYINTNSSNEFYSWLYKYVPRIGSPAWERVLKLNPSQYSKISTVNFNGTTGAGTLEIDLSNITTDPVVSKQQFIVRYSIEGGFPVASSFTYEIVTVDSVRKLRIVFNAVKYEDDAWANLSGNQVVHTFVSYLS
jgi:hypothetical protein